MSKRSIYFSLLLAASTSVYGNAPKFYRHIEVEDPRSAVSSVIETGWQVRDHEPLLLVPPLDWAAAPKQDSNWQFQLNALYPLAPVFQLLELEYVEELHSLARSVISDWIFFNLEKNQDHQFRWNDMATGIRATYLAQLIHYERQHGGNLPTRFEKAAYLHLDELSDPAKLAKSNHALTQLVGIAALCEVLSSSHCAKYEDYARAQYQYVFSNQFNAEGIHLEHSPGYHLLALETFLKIEETGLLELTSENLALLEDARANLQHMIHPDGGLVEFGDSEARNGRRAGLHHPQARWITSHGLEGERPIEGATLFSESGILSIRDIEMRTLLYFSTAHHSRIHKHLDTGSFEWSDRGIRVLVDAGKWGYDRGPERDYVLSQEAHNVLVTKGVSLSPGDVPQQTHRISVQHIDGVYLIESELPAPRRIRDADHRRMLLLSPGEWLIVVDEIDELFLSRQVQWFHFAPPTEVKRTESGFQLLLESGEYMAVVSLSSADDDFQVRGQLNPLLGWYSPGYRQLSPSWQIGFESIGRKVRSATLLRWLDGDTESGLIHPMETSTASEFTELCWREGERLEGVRVSSSSTGYQLSSCRM